MAIKIKRKEKPGVTDYLKSMGDYTDAYIKNDLKDKSIVDKFFGLIAFGSTLAYEIKWWKEFDKIEGNMKGPTSEGQVFLEPGVRDVDLTGGKYGMPTVEYIPGDQTVSRELTELTGLDAELYKIAVDPVKAAIFVALTVGAATVAGYYLPRAVKKIKGLFSKKEIKPDISSILDRIEHLDGSDIQESTIDDLPVLDA